MKLSKEAEILLERYLSVFSHRLPFNSRNELVDEVRSSLYDQLEATAQQEEISEDQMRDVLTNLGAPGKLASSTSVRKNVEIRVLFRATICNIMNYRDSWLLKVRANWEFFL